MPTSVLKLCHRTTYDYRRPVTLNMHRMLLRPREGPTLRLLATGLTVSPDADVNWAQDVFGNSVAVARFHGETDRLVIEATSEVIIDAVQWPVFDIDPEVTSFPFSWRDDVRTDLGVLAKCQYADDRRRLSAWALSFVVERPMDTLTLLKAVNTGLFESMAYEGRAEEGHRAPLDTLQLQRGACRDFAELFAEAVRALGFGARIVTGYLHGPDGRARGTVAGGATHAWAEVFLPGAGWIAFDPTNGHMGGI